VYGISLFGNRTALIALISKDYLGPTDALVA
jgi:hypothetical protein